MEQKRADSPFKAAYQPRSVHQKAVPIDVHLQTEEEARAFVVSSVEKLRRGEEVAGKTSTEIYCVFCYENSTPARHVLEMRVRSSRRRVEETAVAA